jgi:hypothetical protein
MLYPTELRDRSDQSYNRKPVVRERPPNELKLSTVWKRRECDRRVVNELHEARKAVFANFGDRFAKSDKFAGIDSAPESRRTLAP